MRFLWQTRYAREGHDNNFHLIRHVAALAVVLTHSYAVVEGVYEAEPLVTWLGHSIGHYGVDVFFVLSGFLVTQSLHKGGDLLRFAVSRVLRIFPALFIAVLLTTIVLGPLVSTVAPGDYFGSVDLFTYLAGALTTTATAITLPGVFETLPEAGVVNAPLWTLKYELAAYGSLAAIAVASSFAGSRAVLFAATTITLLYVVGRGAVPWPASESFLGNAIHMLLPFYLGAAAYIARRHLPLSPWVALLLTGLAVIVGDTVARELAEKLLITYAILWLAFLPGPRNLERFGDCSYGIYILAFPIQQTIRLIAPDVDPLAVFALAIAITVPLAMLSWHIVERPSLRVRSSVVEWLRTAVRFGNAAAPAHVDTAKR